MGFGKHWSTFCTIFWHFTVQTTDRLVNKMAVIVSCSPSASLVVPSQALSLDHFSEEKSLFKRNLFTTLVNSFFFHMAWKCFESLWCRKLNRNVSKKDCSESGTSKDWHYTHKKKNNTTIKIPHRQPKVNTSATSISAPATQLQKEAFELFSGHTEEI